MENDLITGLAALVCFLVMAIVILRVTNKRKIKDITSDYEKTIWNMNLVHQEKLTEYKKHHSDRMKIIKDTYEREREESYKNGYKRCYLEMTTSGTMYVHNMKLDDDGINISLNNNNTFTPRVLLSRAHEFDGITNYFNGVDLATICANCHKPLKDHSIDKNNVPLCPEL